MSQLDKVATKLQLATIDGVPHGIINDFKYSITEYKVGYVTACEFAFVVDKPISTSELSLLQDEYAKLSKLKTKKIGDSWVLIAPFRYGVNNDKNIAKTNELLKKLTDELIKLKFKTKTTCVFTDSEEGIIEKVIDGVLVPVNKDAFDKLQQAKKEEFENEKKLVKNLPLAILFALIGAIVGSLPTIIVVLVTEYIVAILTAIIPICAFIGYKYAKGPRLTYSLIIISVISLVVGMGSMVVVYAYYSSTVDVSLSQALAIPEIKESFIYDIILTGVFTLMGIGISWEYLRRQLLSK